MNVYVLTIIERNLGVDNIVNVMVYRDIQKAIFNAKDYRNFGFITKVEKKEVL